MKVNYLSLYYQQINELYYLITLNNKQYIFNCMYMLNLYIKMIKC